MSTLMGEFEWYVQITGLWPQFVGVGLPCCELKTAVSVTALLVIPGIICRLSHSLFPSEGEVGSLFFTTLGPKIKQELFTVFVTPYIA